VKTGETLYAISRLYDMNIDNLVALNNLNPPYKIAVGQELQIVKAHSEKPVIAKAENVKEEIKKEVKQASQSIKETVKEKIDKLNHFSWPVRGPVISKFGPKKGGLYNDGINIKAKENSAVKASEDGEVAYVGNELKGYGNLVIIKHSGGWITAYAHLKNTFVNRGQNVKKGQKVGAVGMTGNVTSPQLYFGIRKGRNALNPLNYLK
jgi:murein DD-endopeptidase MepM/ murein hydrolase activator NlpD